MGTFRQLLSLRSILYPIVPYLQNSSWWRFGWTMPIIGGKLFPLFFCFPSDKKWCSSTDNRGIKIREELKTNTRSFKSQFVAPQIASVASGNWVLWKLAEDEEEEEGAIAFGRRRVKTKRRESIWVKIVWFLWMFYGLESGAALGAATKFLLSFNYLWHLWRWPC